jgi:excisionase family DNA binding protein
MSRPYFAPDPIDPLLTTREAAMRLGVSLRTVQLWVEAGTLPAGRTPGGHRRIRLSAVETLAQRSGLRAAAVAQPVMDSPSSGPVDVLLLATTSDQLAQWRQVLGPFGGILNVRAANNGYTGLLQLGRKVPDLLITDLAMPDVDGYAMLRTLAGQTEYERMHVLAYTALGVQAIAERGGLPSQVRVMQHPADPTALRMWMDAEMARMGRRASLMY